MFLYICAFVFVIISTIYVEKDKLKALSPQLIRGVSNDLLFDDQFSLKNTIIKLKELYKLEFIGITEKKVTCGLFKLSCIILPISSVEPEVYLKVYGDKKLSKIIIGTLLIFLLGLIFVFFVLSYVLFEKIKKPLENISTILLPKLTMQIERGSSLEFCNLNNIVEIEKISKSLINMSSALYDSMEKNKMIQIQSKVNEAIAKSTQILAHDVRKPFSILKTIVRIIENENDFQKANSLLKESIIHINRAMMSVEHMISDILEIGSVGSESKIFQEPTNPETLIEASLNEIFFLHNKSNVDFHYLFDHKYKVNIDTLKVLRVFSNIICNALYEMNYNGKIWFKTIEITENEKCYVKFCIGNNGGFISAENKLKIFDVFFTSNKKGGTGLGLSIVKKIINLHGGKIWCESTRAESKEESYVEFFFTLPKSNILITNKFHFLPKNSREISLKNMRLNEFKALDIVESEDIKIEKEIIKKINALMNSICILIVEDESLYRNLLTSLLGKSDFINNKISREFLEEYISSVQFVKKLNPFLIILDIDLGTKEQNGFDLLKVIRNSGYIGFICIHSNLSRPEDCKDILEMGANIVLPKPMTFSHMLRIINHAIDYSLCN